MLQLCACHCLLLVDNCKKMALVFDSVVSSLEVMNCQSIQAQVHYMVYNVVIVTLLTPSGDATVANIVH